MNCETKNIETINNMLLKLKGHLPEGSVLEVARICGLHRNTVGYIMAGHNPRMTDNVQAVFDAARHLLIVRMDELAAERSKIQHLLKDIPIEI